MQKQFVVPAALFKVRLQQCISFQGDNRGRAATYGQSRLTPRGVLQKLRL